MEAGVFNIILGLISVLSFVWSIFSEESRVIAVILGFVLIILALLSDQSMKIRIMANEQKRLGEKLKIYGQLIDIKSDIKDLQGAVFKNGKK